MWAPVRVPAALLPIQLLANVFVNKGLFRDHLIKGYGMGRECGEREKGVIVASSFFNSPCRLWKDWEGGKGLVLLYSLMYQPLAEHLTARPCRLGLPLCLLSFLPSLNACLLPAVISPRAGCCALLLWL